MVTAHYDDEALTTLLQQTDHTDQRLLQHVESCDRCQSRLEALSCGDLSWGDVATLLCPDEHAASVIEGDDWLTSRLLKPSEYPESLGRFARYEIMEILGRGGMGVVMRGYDTSLNRHSAVKVLVPELASSAAARQRFSREARSAAAVVHPHVVAIHTVDEHDGLPYLVMPVLEGNSVEVRVQQSGPLQPIEAVRIAAQVADGLAAAHEQGLVHRDIKPANILLGNGVERVQITDFGLARAIDDAHMTRSGVIAGTPQYMSPEQAHGDAIDHRSDLFSLGSLMYFMLTGRSPFRAETTMGVLNRIANDRPKSLRAVNPDVPSWLEDIVSALLEKRPDERMQSAGEVGELLDGWLAHLQQPATIAPPRTTTKQTDRRRHLLTGAALGMLVWCGWFVFGEPASGNAQVPADGTPGAAAAASANPHLTVAAALPQNDENPDNERPSVQGLPEDQRIQWVGRLGSTTMRAPVVADGQVYVGTNNENAWQERYPKDIDLGVLLCFRESDGQFLWQHANPKTRTGREHDWPQMGITSRPCVEGDRLWYITNRAEIVCLDTQGFRDGENDGSVTDESHTGRQDADIIWRLDMMKDLGVRPHNVSTCTIAVWQDRIFAVTGNGVGPSHLPPVATAASFLALDKNSGKILWRDNSPGQNVLHGQWGSPTVIDRGANTQIVFPGGDGWLYSFSPFASKEGKSQLLWKFDCNEKESVWNLGGRGTRNNLLHGPTLFDDRLYIATGQDPEHGSGPGRLLCLDIDGRGDVSSHLVYNKRRPDRVIAHRRVQACRSEEGDFTVRNDASALVWSFEQQDINNDGEFGDEETMSRSVSTIAIKDDLLFVSDINGILHCLDRHTGRQHWGYDTLSAVYSTPQIAGDHVYVGTEDGEILIFLANADRSIAAPNGQPVRILTCETSVNASVITSGNKLFFTTKNRLIAVEQAPRQQ